MLGTGLGDLDGAAVGLTLVAELVVSLTIVVERVKVRVVLVVVTELVLCVVLVAVVTDTVVHDVVLGVSVVVVTETVETVVVRCVVDNGDDVADVVVGVVTVIVPDVVVQTEQRQLIAAIPAAWSPSESTKDVNCSDANASSCSECAPGFTNKCTSARPAETPWQMISTPKPPSSRFISRVTAVKKTSSRFPCSAQSAVACVPNTTIPSSIGVVSDVTILSQLSDTVVVDAVTVVAVSVMVVDVAVVSEVRIAVTLKVLDMVVELLVVTTTLLELVDELIVVRVADVELKVRVIDDKVAELLLSEIEL